MLGNDTGKCCWYCGSRDHSYEACKTSAATFEFGRPDASLNDLQPAEAVSETEPLAVQLFRRSVPGHSSRNYQCSTCGTLRLAIPADCHDLSFVNCSTCGRSMGLWSKIKNEFWAVAGNGIFSLEHGQILRLWGADHALGAPSSPLGSNTSSPPMYPLLPGLADRK